ncbi:ATP-binding protein [Vibrio alfacsensis]|uniref:ATP-binding protein n=1 Tax=Vibrio alfacsensis TaxID=1074311 RepID=UPI0040675915
MRLFPLFAILLILFSFNTLSASFLNIEDKEYLETKKTLKIGVLNGSWLPYWGDIDSKEGINIEYAEAMVRELGVDAEYVPYKSLDSLFDALESEEIDLSVGFVATKNRAQRFLYSAPIFQTLRLIWLHDDSLASKPLHQLKWVCVEGSSACDQLNALGFEDIHIANSAHMMANSLKSGAADAAIVGLSTLNSYGFKTAKGDLIGKVVYDTNMKPGEVTVFTPKQSPHLMAIINKYIKSSKKSKRSREEIEVNINILHNELMIDILKQERGYDKIRYTINKHSYPLSYIDPKTGKMKGYVHDLLNLLEQKSMLQFEFVDANGKDVDTMLKEGLVDVLPARNIEATDKNHFMVTRPFGSLNYGYIKSLNDSARDSVAILDRSGNFYSHFLPDEDYTSSPVYRSFGALMTAFENGDVSHAFVNQSIIDNHFHKGHGEMFKAVAAPQHINLEIPLGMEVRKDSDLLLQLLNTVLAITTEDEIEQLKARHQQVTVHYGVEKETVIIWALAGTCTLLIAVLVYIVRTRHLTRTIKRKEYETLIRQRQNRWLSSVLDQIPNMILISDDDNKQVLVNKPFRNMLTRCNSDPTISSEERAHLMKLLKQCDDLNSEPSSICHLGEQHFRMHKQTLLHPIDGARYRMTVFDDITELKNKQRALKESNTQAMQAIEARSHFLAVVSHELRTPISAILGLMELLEPELEREENKELFKNAMLSAEHLKLHVNDILDFSKLDANQIQLDILSGNVYQELSPMLRSFEKIAEPKGLGFHVDWVPSPYAVVELDWLRISQVMNNLISNAVKFTENGHVTVRLHVEQDALSLSVLDTGCGMDNSQLSSLFIPFVQGDKSVSRRFGGTGLGMSIVKSLVEIMSGTIEVQSQRNEGTCITVRIPLVSQPLDLTGLGPIYTENTLIQRWLSAWQVTLDEYEWRHHEINSESHYSNVYPDFIYQQLEMTPAMQDMVNDDMPINKNGHVLVVDDDAINRLLFKRQFEKIGIKCTLAPSASEAIAWLNSADNCEPTLSINLIVTDCHMPELDGYQLTTLLKNDQRFSELPIVGCTAENSRNVIEKATHAGMEEVLFKPYGLESLRELCEKYLPIRWDNHASEDWLDAYTPAERSELASVVYHALSADIELIQSGQEKLKSVAHRIKGSAAALNLTLLKHTAKQCELFIGTPQESQAKAELLYELQSIVTSTKLWLDGNGSH